MKRDIDLVRTICCEIEEHDMVRNEFLQQHKSTYPPDLVLGHLGLICEANLAVNIAPTSHGRMFSNFSIALTWEGNDFLSLSRNDAVWNQAQNTVVERAD